MRSIAEIFFSTLSHMQLVITFMVRLNLVFVSFLLFAQAKRETKRHQFVKW